MNLSTKLSAAKRAVTSTASLKALVVQKNSPHILFGAGLVGVVATTVLASRATLKLEAINTEFDHKRSQADSAVELNRDDYSAQDYKQDVALLHIRRASAILKLYGPALSVGVVSVCALTGSHVTLTKRNAGLMAAYAALDKGFKEYRERVVGEIGAEREKEIRYGFEERQVIDSEGKDVSTIRAVDKEKVAGGSIYAKLFDEYNQNFDTRPEYNLIFLRAQQTYANDLLRARGHLMLNDVYDSLGIERTSAGAVVGWVYGNGDSYVDFGIFDNADSMDRFYDFVTGREGAIMLDFNVDGIVYDLIDNKKRARQTGKLLHRNSHSQN